MSLVPLFVACLVASVNGYVFYDGNATSTDSDCQIMIFAGTHNLTLNDREFDLSDYNYTCECTNSTTGKNMRRELAIKYTNFTTGVNDSITDLQLRYSYLLTVSGYWYSQHVNVQFTNKNNVSQPGQNFTEMNVGYIQASAVRFSYSCILPTNITFTGSTNTGAVKNQVAVFMQKWQVQAYGVNGARFADPDHCIGWISSGAWMGCLAAIVLTFWLVLSILALLNTTTPDRFETTKSKCLVIPHEH